MATSSSRMQMTNLRDRNSNYEQREPSPAQYFDNNNYSDQLSSGLKLSLPEEQNAGYEPTTSTGVAFQTRTATRILKGKFDRGSSKDQKFQSTATSQNQGVFQQAGSDKSKMEQSRGLKVQQSNGFGTSVLGNFVPKNPVSQPSNEGLKLVLPDQQDYTIEKQKKLTSLLKLSEPKQQTSNKRIFIEKKQEPKPSVQQAKQSQKKSVPPPPQQPEKKQPPQPNVQEIPIDQLKVQHHQLQEDAIENENQLVECPEGCGRKFNKKALESHAKACKLVFMSKRKQFNSQAKRITSKEQAVIVKQNKQKEKKEIQTKIQKTGQAWKTQSEGFRAVIKALKPQDIPQEGEEEKQIKAVTCEYCEKKFSQILISKHIPICEAKRQKEKKLGKKASKK